MINWLKKIWIMRPIFTLLSNPILNVPMSPLPSTNKMLHFHFDLVLPFDACYMANIIIWCHSESSFLLFLLLLHWKSRKIWKEKFLGKRWRRTKNEKKNENVNFKEKFSQHLKRDPEHKKSRVKGEYLVDSVKNFEN